eukprot:Skav217086  [mRNA]  locus=scaffold1308:149852:159478:- [translate_table: standard]
MAKLLSHHDKYRYAQIFTGYHQRAYAYGYAYVGSYIAIVGWLFGLVGRTLSCLQCRRARC